MVSVRYLYQPGKLECGGHRRHLPYLVLECFKHREGPDILCFIICVTGQAEVFVLGCSLCPLKRGNLPLTFSDISVAICQSADTILHDPALRPNRKSETLFTCMSQIYVFYFILLASPT